MAARAGDQRDMRDTEAENEPVAPQSVQTVMGLGRRHRIAGIDIGNSAGNGEPVGARQHEGSERDALP